jgi:hypothetical protein
LNRGGGEQTEQHHCPLHIGSPVFPAVRNDPMLAQ